MTPAADPHSFEPIRITAVGDGWLAVEKPAGVSVHNDPGGDLRWRLAAQVAADANLRRRIDFDPGYGFHAVGRLDKAADGVVLCAWRPEVFAALSAQYAARQTAKTYLVLLYGRLGSDAAPRTAIEWTWPLSQGAGGRRHPAGRPPRIDCRTDVTNLEQGRCFTLIECRPHTGRKHQIRRHAALAGHPVAGDRRYGPAEAADRLAARCGFDRIGLHAWALRFTPPGADRAVTVKSGGMPASFAALLKADQAEGR